MGTNKRTSGRISTGNITLRLFQGEFISKRTIYKGGGRVWGAMEIVQGPGLSNGGRAIAPPWPKGDKNGELLAEWREGVM